MNLGLRTAGGGFLRANVALEVEGYRAGSLFIYSSEMGLATGRFTRKMCAKKTAAMSPVSLLVAASRWLP